MELDFDRLSEMGVCVLPCPFEDNAFSVVDKSGRRLGKVKFIEGQWVASYFKEIKGRKKKIEDAIKLLL